MAPSARGAVNTKSPVPRKARDLPRAAEAGMSLQQLSKFTGWKWEGISHRIDEGLLDSQSIVLRGQPCGVVLLHQLLAFTETYVRLANLARGMGTKSSALSRLLPGIELGRRPAAFGAEMLVAVSFALPTWGVWLLLGRKLGTTYLLRHRSRNECVGERLHVPPTPRSRAKFGAPNDDDDAPRTSIAGGGYCVRGARGLTQWAIDRLLEALPELSEAERRKLKRTSPHAFRHTIETQMLASGAALEVVQQTLGHASLGTTSIYISPEQSRLRREAAKYHARLTLVDR